MILSIKAKQFKAEIEITDEVLEYHLERNPKDKKLIERVIRAGIMGMSLDVFGIDSDLRVELEDLMKRIKQTALDATEDVSVDELSTEAVDDFSKTLFGR